MSLPRVSIVIPTHNRPQKLNRLLKSITASPTRFDYEVIVVDDSERKTLIEERTRLELRGRLRVLWSRDRIFISKAKNQGWRQAQGEYILFVDDDNILPKSTIESLVTELEKNRQLGALMPIVYYERRRDLIWVYATPFSPGRWSFRLIGRDMVERGKPQSKLLPTDALPNAFIVRRGVLERVGGFDESLPVNSSCDFCQKVKGLGLGTYALTTAWTFHDVTLPHVPGYWAEHAAADPARRYYEVRDWFVLMARLHHQENLLVAKELLRALPFLLASIAGVLLHPSGGKRIPAIYGSMLRGVIDGVHEAASHPSEHESYTPVASS